jgi:dipeptidyl aminopeptidase/acylaminoacyl peptidase
MTRSGPLDHTVSVTHDVLTVTVDGVATSVSRWMPADERTSGVVVACHGGVDGLDTPMEQAAERIAGRGLAVLAPHYRGEDGRGSRRDIGTTDVADVLASADVASSTSATVALWGQSRGGLVALLAAATRPGRFAAVAATAPIDSLAFLHDVMAARGHEVAAEIEDRLGGPPTSAPAAYAWRDVARRADALRGQSVMLAHAADDTVVPVDRTLALLGRLCGPAELIAVLPPFGGHRAVYDVDGIVWRSLVPFLERSLCGAAPSSGGRP